MGGAGPGDRGGVYFGLACAVPSVTDPSGRACAFVRLQFYFSWADEMREFSTGDIPGELTDFLAGSAIE